MTITLWWSSLLPSPRDWWLSTAIMSESNFVVDKSSAWDRKFTIVCPGSRQDARLFLIPPASSSSSLWPSSSSASASDFIFVFDSFRYQNRRHQILHHFHYYPSSSSSIILRWGRAWSGRQGDIWVFDGWIMDEFKWRRSIESHNNEMENWYPQPVTPLCEYKGRSMGGTQDGEL